MLNKYKKASGTLIILILLLIPEASSCQYSEDVIYTKAGLKVEGSIISINKSKILFADSQSVDLKDFALGMKSNGDILISSDAENKMRWLKNTENDFHKIITLKKEVFAAEKVEIINDKVGYQDHRSGRYFLLDISEVALIIYKNGIHKILAEPLIANQCLSEVKDLNAYSTRQPSTTIQLSNEEQDYFARRALTKTRAFGSYLSTITDERVDELYQDDAVKLALGLFYDENRMVEVSSLNGEEVESFKIADYLARLRMLTYAKVEMVWNQVAYVNQIRSGEDGEYRGIISVEQIFKGYNSDNVVIYQDITQKNIEIIVKPLKQIIDGEEISKWDVYLSDIGVKSTTEL
ncbi:hypothetical protein [Catalinimonas niigatensis]|uniref:hypothetical protein n=1 Tax=Catalinimonas niigatensis TaxID=1397264 RepID=UPI0026666B5C|nr:hypothetical protein [Catalinimonas niigatensis]WPP49141.1 hypothetical protein PZB72_20960 [Catalinimonas niigatensis]